MVDQNAPLVSSLDRVEKQAKDETRRLQSPTLGAIELLLNSYLTGFGELGTFTRTDSSRLRAGMAPPNHQNI